MNRKRWMILLLVLIILSGGFLRFYGVNWDSYKAFHPDERNISWAVTRIRFFDQLNPKFFAYGGLPIYLYRALGEGVVGLTHNPRWLADWGYIAVIGRSVSAALSTVSIVLVYLVATAYFSPSVGLVSCSFLAFSPWAIREAHFQTTETMLVFFILLLLLFAKKIRNTKYEIRKNSHFHTVIILGIVWGLALAAKTTSVLFGIIPLSAIIFSRKKVLFTFLLVTIAVLIFFLFSPYTILDLAHFRESMAYESGVALGRLPVPYTLQFLHTTPYLYQIQTMLWQAGPLVIVGLAGFIGMIIQIFRRIFARNTKYVIRNTMFLLFPLLYFAWVGSWFAKFSRYNVPFLPFVTIAAAWLMVSVYKKIPKNSFYWIIGLLVYWIIGLFTVWWGLANWTVFLRPQTRFAATEWMFAHIPPNAKIYTEHWNDGLPLDLPDEIGYRRELLTIYDEDNSAKKIYYTDKLVTGDFVILSTRRMWATMPRLGEKYPLTKLFYERLLNGTLGYKEVAVFASYPQLFGVAINDDGAEESVQVFDHPTVRIFQNTQHLSREEIFSRLTQ